ncbi:MAG: glycosyltransferase [Candidatus Desulfacyla sp.]
MKPTPAQPKILILNNDLPVFPGWGGIEYLHTTYLAQMTRKVGLVSLVHTGEQAQKKKRLADAGVSLYLWENPNLITGRPRNVEGPDPLRRTAKTLYDLGRSLLCRPYDTLSQDFQFSTLSGHILQALNEETWDALIVVQSSCARWIDYLPRFPVSVLMMHDARALMYERRAKIAKTPFERATLVFQAMLYRRFERIYSRKYDLVVTVSSTDAAWVRKHYRPRRVVTIPIPIDDTYFSPMPEEPVDCCRILFTGMMNHPPNVDAVLFFAHTIFPKIRRAVPRAQFWVVGRDPTEDVRRLASLPGIVVTGFVPDIRQHKASSAVEVVPLRFGAGMRQKILEAWAMKKCVVSTSIGAEGLDYQDGANILIADDANAMAQQVVKVLNSPEKAAEIGERACETVSKRHSPVRLSAAYFNAISSLFARKRACQRPMRTAIDLRWMLPGVAGGIETLTRAFINELKGLDRFNHYTLLAPSEIKYDFDLRNNDNFSVIIGDGPAHYGKMAFRGAVQRIHQAVHVHYWRTPEVNILNDAKVVGSDLVLSLSGYIYPDMRPLRNVVVVPDIQHEYYPDFFPPDVLAERRRIYSESILAADGLIAISEYTRQTLIEKFGIDPARIHTVHLAADPVFQRENQVDGNRERVLRKYRLPEQGYLFLPANTWPHKNHRGAIEALQILRQDYGRELMLVFTGSHKEAQGELNRLIAQNHLDRAVRFLGYCPVNDLIGLYEGAAALIYPSFFEGFGIPLLEAMWTDCPVVCSNLTSLPEIAGDAALLVDPHSPEALADAVNRLISDGALRTDLIARGRKRVEAFSWSRFTIEVVKVLHRIHTMGG